MLDPSGPTPIWVVWPYLGSLERLLFITLVVLGDYVLFSAVITLLRVRKAGVGNPVEGERDSGGKLNAIPL
jgi:hypothetical protein